jgi:hypothetical protein
VRRLLRWLLARLPGTKRMWDMLTWKEPRQKALRIQTIYARSGRAVVSIAVVPIDEPDTVLWAWDNIKLVAMSDRTKEGEAKVKAPRVIINLDADTEVDE